MAHRHIHYEAAFEDYVRSQGWAYLPIDEQKRAIFSGARVKSFDFLVYPPGQRAWLVDVKGRKFPYEVNGNRRYWENWVTLDDLNGLDRWRGVFGDDFDPVLVFVYWLTEGDGLEPSDTVHQFRGQSYAFLWVSAEDYARSARRRSEKWETVSVPTKTFRSLARPVTAAG
jgi:hypothetical protein